MKIRITIHFQNKEESEQWFQLDSANKVFSKLIDVFTLLHRLAS